MLGGLILSEFLLVDGIGNYICVGEKMEVELEHHKDDEVEEEKPCPSLVDVSHVARRWATEVGRLQKYIVEDHVEGKKEPIIHW